MPGKTILSDTKGFTQKLYNTLNTLESQTLLAALEAASLAYRNSSYYKSSMNRLDFMLTNIRALPYSKMGFVGAFFNSGKWNRYSANTFVMLALINLTDHKRTKEETDDYLHEKILQGLSTGLREQIEIDIKYSDKYAKDRYQELQARQQSLNFTVPDLPDVLLAGSREEGRLLKESEPEKFVYALSERRLTTGESGWELTWFDDLCNPAYLTLSSRLSTLLDTLDSFKLPEPGSERYDQLKFCCHELFPAHSDVYVFNDRDTARDVASRFPDKFVFYINAVEQNASSSSSSSSSSNPTTIKWKLAWYDRNGREKPLLIPAGIATVLARQHQELDLCSFAGFQLKEQCHGLVDDLLKGINVLIAPKPDDVTSVYVIEGSKLTWYGIVGEGQDVPVADFPALANWLASNPDRAEMTESERVYLKTLLRHLCIKRNVDVDKQNLIKNIVLKHLNLPLSSDNNISIVADMTQVDPQRERSDSFLLSMGVNGWSIGYVNSLQRLLPVEWQTLPDVAAVVQSLPDEPSKINYEHLAALTNCLSRHKPSGRLEMDRFSNIEACLRAMTREVLPAGSAATEEQACLTRAEEEVSPRKSITSGKFASQYATMEAFFSPKKVAVPRESFMADQSYTPESPR